jgi:hypothetical protein
MYSCCDNLQRNKTERGRERQGETGRDRERQREKERKKERNNVLTNTGLTFARIVNQNNLLIFFNFKVIVGTRK